MRNLFSLSTLAASLGLAVAAELPIITLPWGKYKAEAHPGDEEILIFRNIRFGTVTQRFGTPYLPGWLSTKLQDTSTDFACYQVDPTKIENAPGGNSSVQVPVKPLEHQTEDCLFLDIYVPAYVFEDGGDTEPLPVVTWIYGGGYAYGSKNQGGPLYDGRSVLNASIYSNIFVAANYRTGAFGWLAGDYMQKAGQPNAGLYDQALMLEWVQKYIGLVHGDNKKVSAWGQSSGAGSILHHLTREEGTKDPGFGSFMARSPSFTWQWDNSPGGKLDTIYKTFSRLAGCDSKFDIDCLRKADISKLATANQKLYDILPPTGPFPIGPSVDGKWIKSLPSIAFSEGKYWKKISASMITRVSSEGSSFVYENITTKAEYETFLDRVLPSGASSDKRKAVLDQYECDPEYDKYQDCAAAIIGDATVNCNVRNLIDAYSSTSYAMEYQFPSDGLAYHGSDLVPVFSKTKSDTSSLLKRMNLPEGSEEVLAGALMKAIVDQFQGYLGGFAAEGNPNSFADKKLYWPSVDIQRGFISSIMYIRGSKFIVFQDSRDTQAICSAWTDLAKDIVGTKASAGGSPLRIQPELPAEMNNEL